MYRGRHAKPSRLLTRLLPGRAARRSAELTRQRDLVRAHFDEVLRLRTVGTVLAAEAAQASVRARRAEELARAARAELSDLRAETAALREDLVRLREDVLWAWADGRLPSKQAVAPAAPQDARTTGTARILDLRTG